MTIRQYLSKLKMFTNMKTYMTWVLKKGKSFSSPGKLTAKGKQDIKESRYSTRARECYYNAQMLAINDSRYKYYEGWYLWEDIPIPLEHGFNVRAGKVIDTTQHSQNKQRKRSYFGVHIPTSFIRKNMQETGMAEAILHTYFRHTQKK